MSKPYLYTAENTKLILVSDGRGEELRLHLMSAGIPSRLSRIPGVAAELLSFDRDAEVVRAILDQREA